MDNISSTLSNLTNYYSAINENLSNYTGNVIKKIKQDTKEQDKILSEIKNKELDIKTGDQLGDLVYEGHDVVTISACNQIESFMKSFLP